MEENKTNMETSGIEEQVKARANEFEEQLKAGANEFEENLKAGADEIVENLKGLVKEGNVTRIRIRKDENIILDLPMTVGIVGTVLGLAAAPWAVILATIATVGLNCTVEVEKKDGSITVIHGKEA